MKKLIFVIIFILFLPLNYSDSVKYNVTDGNDDYYLWFYDDLESLSGGLDLNLSFDSFESDSDSLEFESGLMDSETSGGVYDSNLLQSARIKTIMPFYTAITYININTSLIPNNHTIISANLSFYIDSYTVRGRPQPAKTYLISINGNLFNVSLHTINGWYKHEINLSFFSDINKNGLTYFIVSVPDVSSSQSRDMYIRSSEYSGDYGAYLDIYHKEIITETEKISPSQLYFILVLSLWLIFISISFTLKGFYDDKVVIYGLLSLIFGLALMFHVSGLFFIAVLGISILSVIYVLV